jgi:hypothetical protein
MSSFRSKQLLRPKTGTNWKRIAQLADGDPPPSPTPVYFLPVWRK